MKLTALRTCLAMTSLAIALAGCDNAYIPSEHQRLATGVEAAAALDQDGYAAGSYTGLHPIEEDFWCAGVQGGTTCWWIYYDKDKKAPHAWTPPPDEIARLTSSGAWPPGAVPG